jgi:hypothetical protein
MLALAGHSFTEYGYNLTERPYRINNDSLRLEIYHKEHSRKEKGIRRNVPCGISSGKDVWNSIVRHFQSRAPELFVRQNGLAA